MTYAEMKKRTDTDKFLYHLVGGEHTKRLFNFTELVNFFPVDRLHHNYTAERAAGRCVPREELDDQPEVRGYLGPMWDGERYLVDGVLKSAWELPKDQRETVTPDFYVIRYETQEVYNAMCN
jgi:hypothetical protein